MEPLGSGDNLGDNDNFFVSKRVPDTCVGLSALAERSTLGVEGPRGDGERLGRAGNSLTLSVVG